jgi:dienelactone hydrolase
MKFLGPMPERPISAGFEVLRDELLPRVRRQLIRYEAEAGLPVEGYLLTPRSVSSRPRAGVVALHQTTRDTIEQVAGVKGPAVQQIGLQLAERGFVVICPRNYLWQNVSKYSEAVERFGRRHPDTLGMHKMLHDARRAVDILVGLPGVDAGRIGATGHSLGGKETLYLAAFDERIAAAVASEGGMGFRFTNWNAAWYLGRGIEDESFPLNHHQLLALAAPRPFLVLAGENSSPSASDGDRTWPLVEAALPAWRLYGDRPRLGLYNHRQGHSIPPTAFARMHEWLATYLRPGVPG